MSSQFYRLPSSPDVKIIDRFSLLDDIALPASEKLALEAQIEQDPSGSGFDLVPLWPLLTHLLCSSSSPPPTALPELASLLDTISVTVRGTARPAGDYALLRDAIAACFGGAEPFFRRVWPRLARLALEMPALFPDHRLPVLGRRRRPRAGEDGCGGGGEARVRLSRRQVACLVVHQFLRTLDAPEWKAGRGGEGEGEEGEREALHDFGVWYDGGQKHVEAVRGYLTGLMRYFDRVVCGDLGDGDDGWVVEYRLCLVDEAEFRGVLEKKACSLSKVDVKIVERYDLLPESLGIPAGAAVVSANRQIGFGQSATQEEVHVGSSPEACPAVLVTPPLEDDQVLVVRGAQAMVNITGQRRDIRIEDMPVTEDGEVWKQRTMLFMDALELDMAEAWDSLPDLLPGNMDREIRKAYTALSSGGYREIRTGLWGCGAFCGDPGVKMLLVWLAASLAGTTLVVVCDGTGQAFAEQFRRVADKARVLRDTTELHQMLMQAPRSLVKGETLAWFEEQLERRVAMADGERREH
ncbi:hypothetical protein VTK26DRAFT_9027 [Humicola hyalothermophila]